MTTKGGGSRAKLAPAAAGLAAAGAIAAMAVWAPWAGPPRGAAIPDESRLIAMGRDLYGAHCAACHGARLEGQPDWRTRRPDGRLPAPPHDETGHTWHHPDADLFRMVKHGLTPPLAPAGYQSDMPAFAALLSDEEIRAVLAYIKDSWPPEIRARQSRLNDGANR